ncbi:hypothetical protein EWM64_g872 [Hericium alpestre]|uniref:Uncharacterized protein n=1 Tax=Hericium alpestre TaxID=135208 RepID=A0A4Z0AA08_9AGAM|nr:hypothetical protein EWM64_g872 [Hericium alpestre]
MSPFLLFIILFSFLYPGLTITLAIAAPAIRDTDLQNSTHVRNVSIFVGSIGFSILFIVSMLAFLRVTAQARHTRHSPHIHLPPYHTARTTRTQTHAVALRAHPDPSSSAVFEPSVAVEVEVVELTPLRAAHTADQVRRCAYDASSGSESSVESRRK